MTKVRRVFENKEIISSVNNPDELTVFIDDIKTTFLKYPFPVQNKLIDYDGIKLLDVKEIVATKAYTIGGRGTIKDYVDLFFIISGRISSLEEIIQMAKKNSGMNLTIDYFWNSLFILMILKKQISFF